MRSDSLPTASVTPYSNSIGGQDARCGFRVSTDESVGDWGWSLDDIRVFECVAANSDEIFSDGFESSTTSESSSTVGGP
jgi:hypothetical protein